MQRESLMCMHVLAQRLPERIVEKAVKGMLPSGRIGRHLFTHLKVHPPPDQAASSLLSQGSPTSVCNAPTACLFSTTY